MDMIKDYLSSCVVADGKCLEGYSKIYFKTNENLVRVYKMANFQGKDVFTVLASSDQVFMAKNLGAKKVDSFDKNPLTIYYYYLRSWAIQYKNMLYPKPILDNGYQWLDELLSMIQPKSKEESDALRFWKGHLNRLTNFDNLFFNDEVIGNISFSSKDQIPSSEMKFQVVDLFEENEFEEDYDIVVLSNIIEWAHGSKLNITCVRDNLERLLRQGGVALCSNIIYRSDDEKRREREIFDYSFQFIDCKNQGYVYQKR